MQNRRWGKETPQQGEHSPSEELTGSNGDAEALSRLGVEGTEVWGRLVVNHVGSLELQPSLRIMGRWRTLSKDEMGFKWFKTLSLAHV